MQFIKKYIQIYNCPNIFFTFLLRKTNWKNTRPEAQSHKHPNRNRLFMTWPCVKACFEATWKKRISRWSFMASSRDYSMLTDRDDPPGITGSLPWRSNSFIRFVPYVVLPPPNALQLQIWNIWYQYGQQYIIPFYFFFLVSSLFEIDFLFLNFAVCSQKLQSYIRGFDTFWADKYYKNTTNIFHYSHMSHMDNSTASYDLKCDFGDPLKSAANIFTSPTVDKCFFRGLW